jgi:hypothetical protein
MALAGIALLTVAAIGVRTWLMIAYSPFLSYPDSSQYAVDAGFDIFHDPQRPAGYPFFLRLVHHLSHALPFTIAVQHAAGVVTGLLLYKAVRRTGAPPLVGLLPAAVAFFGATGLILEHALLSDSLYTFLQAVVVYLAVRALYDPRLRWALLAGVAIGLAFWVRTVAVTSGALVPVVLLCAAPGGIRRRVLAASSVAAIVAAMIVVYVGVQYYFTGYLGYERQSAWDLYGRVATFVDCRSFAPPPGTSFLCPAQPLGQRPAPSYFLFDPGSPAVQRFGPPYSAPQYANGVLKRFSVAAIEHEPIAYAGAIVRSLGYYVFPSGSEGNGPPETREEVSNPVRVWQFAPAFATFYTDSLGYHSPKADLDPLAAYESFTRVQGALMIALLLAAIAGPFLLPRRPRWAATLFTLTALVSITFAVAANTYDARYASPTFAPLAAGAALGAWGLGVRVSGSPRRRRRRPVRPTGPRRPGRL